MRSVLVVVGPPFFDNDPGLFEKAYRSNVASWQIELQKSLQQRARVAIGFPVKKLSFSAPRNRKPPATTSVASGFLERAIGIEPTTFSLGIWQS